MDEPRNRGTLILGALLVAGGLLFLAAQVFGGAGAQLWPLVIMVIGALFFIGMVLGGRQAGPLAIPGSIIVGVGLIGLLQNALGWWEAALFSWALIVAAVGVGLIVYGAWSDQPGLRARGWRVAGTGLMLFIVFGALVELILSALGVVDRGNRLLWPVLLIAAGLLQFVFRVFQVMRRPAESREKDIDLVGPLFLAGIGGVAYLVMTGQVSPVRVLALLNLWPVLLIALGVMLLLRGRFALIGAVVGILLVALMFGVLLAGDRLGISQTPWWFQPENFGRGGPVTERVQGSGRVTTETRAAADFDGVTVNLGANVEITPGASEGLTIEAEDNLLPYITHEVKGRQLIIETRPGVGLLPTRPIQLRIGARLLNAMTMNGAGDVVIHRLESDRLALTSSGWSMFRLDELSAGNLDIVLSGGGSVTAAGKVDRLNLQISGAGNLAGGDLRARQVNVQISGFGQATVWATETLNSQISGFGGVSYYGSPTLSQSTGGVGGVTKLGDK